MSVNKSCFDYLNGFRLSTQILAIKLDFEDLKLPNPQCKPLTSLKARLVQPRTLGPKNHQVHQRSRSRRLQTRSFPRTMDSGLSLLGLESNLPRITPSPKEIPRKQSPVRLRPNAANPRSSARQQNLRFTRLLRSGYFKVVADGYRGHAAT